MSRTKIVWLLAPAAGLLPAALPAHALTLAELTAPDATPIVQGDKTYSNFAFSSATLDASDVTVSLVPGQFGLRFAAHWDTSLQTLIDTVIQYDVAVTDPSLALAAVGLSFNATASGGGVAFVGEQIQDLNSAAVYNLHVLTDGSGPLADQLEDSVSLNPTQRVHVLKDITVTGVRTDSSACASIGFVDNTFVQTGGAPPPAIPEPASLALIPLSLLGLALRRKLAR